MFKVLNVCLRDSYKGGYRPSEKAFFQGSPILFVKAFFKELLSFLKAFFKGFLSFLKTCSKDSYHFYKAFLRESYPF